MLNVTKDLKSVLKDLIREEINETKGIDIFQITSVNDDQTYSIKRLNTSESFNRVNTLGLGLGNGKGQIKLYDENDLVLVTFIQNSELPIILGSIYDDISITKDTRINIKRNEYYVNNRADGSFIFIDENNNILIRTKDLNGTNQSLVKLTNDGDIINQIVPGSNKSVGSASILVGNTDVTITNSRVTVNSKVFMQETDQYSGDTKWISNVSVGSFKVNVATAPTTNPINFYYWIIDG